MVSQPLMTLPANICGGRGHPGKKAHSKKEATSERRNGLQHSSSETVSVRVEGSEGSMQETVHHASRDSHLVRGAEAATLSVGH